jgi:hypothetical protein
MEQEQEWDCDIGYARDGKGRVRQLVVSSKKPEEGSAVAKEVVTSNWTC